MKGLEVARDSRDSEDSHLQPGMYAPQRRGLWATTKLYLSPRRFSAGYLWLGFLIVFGVIVPETFLTATTARLVFSSGAVTCMLALAFLIPMATGAYDLTIGAVLSLSLALSVWLSTHTGLPAPVGALLVVSVCAMVGFVSGFLVVRLRLDSLIATLGMSQILFASVIALSGNQQMVGEFSSSWSELGNGDWLGVPYFDLYLIAVAVVIWFVLEHHRIGRYLLATGGNSEAARLAGVPTNRLVWGSFVASAVVSGLAGIMLSMSIGTWSIGIGPGYLFPAVTAAFLGASQLSGRPNVWGTLTAYFALAFGVQGLSLASTSGAVWSAPLFQGVALVFAVALASVPVAQRRRRRRLPKVEES